jgi:hypothetical protein
MLSALPEGRSATLARRASSREGIAATHTAVIEWCDANGRAWLLSS